MKLIRQSYLIPLNAQAWRSPTFNVQRHNGHYRAVAGADEQSETYKSAIRESLREQGATVLPGPYKVWLYYFRQIENQKNAVDATNIQKLTEDALQGVLINNDREVFSIQSQIIEQSHDVVDPFVVILIEAGRAGEITFPFGFLDMETRVSKRINDDARNRLDPKYKATKFDEITAAAARNRRNGEQTFF